MNVFSTKFISLYIVVNFYIFVYAIYTIYTIYTSCQYTSCQERDQTLKESKSKSQHI